MFVFAGASEEDKPVQKISGQLSMTTPSRKLAEDT